MSWLKKHFWADNRGKVSTGKVPFYKSNIFLIWDPLLAGYFVAKSNGQITPVLITRDENTWSDHFMWSGPFRHEGDFWNKKIEFEKLVFLGENLI